MLGVLAVLAIAYRYYSAFLAARVAVLDDQRETPAHRFRDGQNFDPTNRWVLFGHHFAAISGAGPLIGPVLAIQFGYLPGLVWLVVGVCLAGAVQDMMVLALSTQRGGQSLASLARRKSAGRRESPQRSPSFTSSSSRWPAWESSSSRRSAARRSRSRPGPSSCIPPDSGISIHMKRGGPRVYQVPSQVDLPLRRRRPSSPWSFTSRSSWPCPPARRSSSISKAKGFILPEKARRLVPGSSWGTFTIACTIPIALFVGWYMYRLRKGKVVEASIIGGLAVLAATVAGALVPGSPLDPYFSLSRDGTVLALAVYGFIAAVLPVWLLLCPRDYLSSFLKIGTILLLVAGVIVANPKLEAPVISPYFAHGGGPYFDGPIFPYVFICIMCGAISGFHSLVSSGTTPKMVNRESDIRMIGYGAMLMEGLVGVVALIAAAALPNAMYYDINIDLGKRPTFMAKHPDFAQFLKASELDLDGGPDPDQAQRPPRGAAPSAGSELVAMEQDVRESLHGRTGGAVTLAVGMARIFSKPLPGLRWLIAYWYHFAIMFEALFILTTIDAGTRIARFLVQEFLGRLWKPLGNLDWLPAALLATGLVVCGWGYFIWTGSVETIWPMFGMANQLLAVIALAVVTTGLVNAGRGRYAAVTLLPMLFVATTTSTTGYYEITGKFWNMIKAGQGEVVRGWLNIGLTLDAPGLRGRDPGPRPCCAGFPGRTRSRPASRPIRNWPAHERSLQQSSPGPELSDWDWVMRRPRDAGKPDHAPCVPCHSLELEARSPTRQLRRSGARACFFASINLASFSTRRPRRVRNFSITPGISWFRCAPVTGAGRSQALPLSPELTMLMVVAQPSKADPLLGHSSSPFRRINSARGGIRLQPAQPILEIFPEVHAQPSTGFLQACECVPRSTPRLTSRAAANLPFLDVVPHVTFAEVVMQGNLGPLQYSQQIGPILVHSLQDGVNAGKVSAGCA